MKRVKLTASILALMLAVASTGCKKAFEDETINQPSAVIDTDDGQENLNNKEDLDEVINQTITEQADDYIFNLQTPNKIIGHETSVTVEGTGAEASGQVATITKSGDYIVEGTLNDGQLIVDLDKTDLGTVKLILNGASLASSTGAALRIKTAPKVSIYLAEGSKSSLKSTCTADSMAAIQSSQDIYFSSSEANAGSLEVASTNFHGIKSTDGIIIKSGNISVKAPANDGIQAKDFIKISGGSITVECLQHGLKTTSDKEDKGFVYMDGGNLSIASTYKESSSEISGKDGFHATGSINILGGSTSISSYGDGIYSAAHIIIKGGSHTISQSNKCISAMGNITIDGGDLSLSPNAKKTSQEDGFGHGITVKKTSSGTRVGNVTINNGNINIAQSYEGIQGCAITINGGTTIINSLDDAVNASDGSSQGFGGGGFGPRPGGFGSNTTTQSSNVGLYINGGLLMVTAQGDGIDSNGELIINGGITLVSQYSNANEPIDAGDGYEPEIRKGLVIAAGTRGMASAPKVSQTSFFVSATSDANKFFAVNDGDGESIVAWKIPQQYDIITVSAPELSTGTYTYITNATVKGTEHTKGTGLYYPADSATGSGKSVSLTSGKCTSSVGGGYGPGR